MVRRVEGQPRGGDVSRTCYRCSRSIGAALACRVCVREFALQFGRRQWPYFEAFRKITGRDFPRVGRNLSVSTYIDSPEAHAAIGDNAWEPLSDTTHHRSDEFAANEMLRVLRLRSVFPMTAHHESARPCRFPANDPRDDVAEHVYRALDEWLYALTGNLPESDHG